MKNNKKFLTLLVAISSLLLSACSNILPKWISKTNACDGDNFVDKMENHLMSFGIEKATLEHIREIFVPGYAARA